MSESYPRVKEEKMSGNDFESDADFDGDDEDVVICINKTCTNIAETPPDDPKYCSKCTRHCQGCGVFISNRRSQAKRCNACAAKTKNAQTNNSKRKRQQQQQNKPSSASRANRRRTNVGSAHSGDEDNGEVYEEEDEEGQVESSQKKARKGSPITPSKSAERSSKPSVKQEPKDSKPSTPTRDQNWLIEIGSDADEDTNIATNRSVFSYTNNVQLCPIRSDVPVAADSVYKSLQNHGHVSFQHSELFNHLCALLNYYVVASNMFPAEEQLNRHQLILDGGLHMKRFDFGDFSAGSPLAHEPIRNAIMSCGHQANKIFEYVHKFKSDSTHNLAMSFAKTIPGYEKTGAPMMLFPSWQRFCCMFLLNNNCVPPLVSASYPAGRVAVLSDDGEVDHPQFSEEFCSQRLHALSDTDAWNKMVSPCSERLVTGAIFCHAGDLVVAKKPGHKPRVVGQDEARKRRNAHTFVETDECFLVVDFIPVSKAKNKEKETPVDYKVTPELRNPFNPVSYGCFDARAPAVLERAAIFAANYNVVTKKGEDGTEMKEADEEFLAAVHSKMMVPAFVKEKGDKAVCEDVAALKKRVQELLAGDAPAAKPASKLSIWSN